MLDIGCNSGLSSLIAAFAASQVLGCDRNPVLIARAKAGKNAVCSARDFSSVCFEVGDFTDFLRDDIDAIVAARVLYHLTDEGVGRLSDFITSREKFTVVVHTRPGRRKGATKVYNGLVDVQDVSQFFSDLGLEMVSEWGAQRQRFMVGLKG